MEHVLEHDPGHVRTREHYEAMVRELRAARADRPTGRNTQMGSPERGTSSGGIRPTSADLIAPLVMNAAAAMRAFAIASSSELKAVGK